MSTKIKDSVISSVIDATNPFLLTYPTGKPMIFRQEHEPYYYVMMTIKRNCLKGYVELPFILCVLYETMKLKDAKRMSAQMVELKVPYITLLQWGTKSCKVYFTQFFQALHEVIAQKYNYSISGFNYNAFQTAYTLVQNAFELDKVHEKPHD